MRPLLLASLIATALLAPFAAADHAYSCDPPREVPTKHLEVDVYRGNCAGATVAAEHTACIGGGEEQIGRVHLIVLADNGCETGVVVETWYP